MEISRSSTLKSISFPLSTSDWSLLLNLRSFILLEPYDKVPTLLDGDSQIRKLLVLLCRDLEYDRQLSLEVHSRWFLPCRQYIVDLHADVHPPNSSKTRSREFLNDMYIHKLRKSNCIFLTNISRMEISRLQAPEEHLAISDWSLLLNFRS